MSNIKQGSIDFASTLFYLTRENIGLINYTVKEQEWSKLSPVAKEKFSTFANLIKQLKGVDDLDIDDSARKDPPEWTEWRKEIFKYLKEKRNYKLTAGQRAGEAKTMSWLFKQDYKPDDIIKAYDTMNAQPFWSDKPLTLMTVAKQIGAMYQKKPSRDYGKFGMTTAEEVNKAKALRDKYKECSAKGDMTEYFQMVHNEEGK